MQRIDLHIPWRKNPIQLWVNEVKDSRSEYSVTFEDEHGGEGRILFNPKTVAAVVISPPESHKPEVVTLSGSFPQAQESQESAPPAPAGIPNMEEGFSEDALRVLQLAREEAAALKHHWFGPEHLLLGFARALAGEEGIAGAVGVEALRQVLPPGVGGPEIRERVLELVPPEAQTEANGEWRITPGMERIVSHAAKLAADNGDGLVSTQHLILGMFGEEDGVGARVLSDLGVTERDLRARLVELGVMPGPVEPTDAPEP